MIKRMSTITSDTSDAVIVQGWVDNNGELDGVKVQNMTSTAFSNAESGGISKTVSLNGNRLLNVGKKGFGGSTGLHSEEKRQVCSTRGCTSQYIGRTRICVKCEYDDVQQILDKNPLVKGKATLDKIVNAFMDFECKIPQYLDAWGRVITNATVMALFSAATEIHRLPDEERRKIIKVLIKECPDEIDPLLLGLTTPPASE